MRDARGHTPVLMLAVPAFLLAVAMAAGLIPGAVPAIERAATHFADHGAYAAWVLGHGAIHWPATAASHVSADDVLYGSLSTAGALAFAALGLFGRPLRKRLPSSVGDPLVAGLGGLRRLHSGHIGDYVAWWTAGAALLGGACLLALG
jgi:multicomponent Na+:H+ antiporter subunit D